MTFLLIDPLFVPPICPVGSPYAGWLTGLILTAVLVHVHPQVLIKYPLSTLAPRHNPPSTLSPKGLSIPTHSLSFLSRSLILKLIPHLSPPQATAGLQAMVGRQGKASAGRLGVKYAFPFLSRGSSCRSVGRPAGGSKQLVEGWRE